MTAPAGRVVVVAGAGSGKTRVLTRRIAWRVAKGETAPDRVLALTFTRKAAAELRSRQRQLGLRQQVPAGTIHSFALSQLRQRWAERRTVPPTLINQKLRFISQICRPPSGVELLDVVAEIEWARARMIEPEHYSAEAQSAGRVPPATPEFISELMVTYTKEKRRKRVVDFDDLLVLAIRDLRADPDYAAAVRWRHRHFYIDEFQDVNPLQHQLIMEWLGDRDDLFLVGDPRQSIYGWNGADPGLMSQMISGEATVTIHLGDNYRSTPQVLGLADVVLSLSPSAGPGSGPDVQTRPMTANRADGPAPTLQRYASDRAEAVGVAEAVRHANRAGYPYAQQAVLVRTNAQLALIEQELSAMGLPTRLRGGPGPLGSPEVKAVLQDISRQGIDLVQQLEALDQQLGQDRESTAGGDGGDTSEDSGEPIQPAGRHERFHNLAALSRLLHDYLSTDPAPDGPGFLAWLSTLGNGDVDSDNDAVDLVTFHGAKGLEWPVVHIAGLEDGFVPIAYATTQAQLAEELRLLYVALTRAEVQLNLSWAEQRTFATKAVDRRPAPVLDRLATAMAELGGRSLIPDWRAHLERSRDALTKNRPIDLRDDAEPPAGSADLAPDEAYERLRQWRARKARGGMVPPHVIVSDQVLRAVADHRPSTIGQLAAVTNLRPTKLARFGQDLLDALD